MIKINNLKNRKTNPLAYKQTVNKNHNNADFKQTINYKYKVKIKEELNQLINKIDFYGKLFSDNPSQNNLNLYKNHIQTFFQFAQSSAFKIKEIYGRKLDYKIITTIDKKIEELSSQIMKKEANRFDILHSINEIKGLIIDLLL